MGYRFNGAVTFDAQLKLFGVTVKRRMRVTYGYTPEWAFVDSTTGQEKTEARELKLALEVLARPRAEIPASVTASEHEPYWTSANQLLKYGVLNRRIYERLTDLIDGEARVEDLELRGKLHAEPNLKDPR